MYLPRWIQKNTKDMNSICELGAGIFNKFKHYTCGEKIGIELSRPYVNNRVYKHDEIAICGDALEFEKHLGDLRPDVFALIDFLEHLDKNVGFELIERLKNFPSTKRIIVYAPEGTHNLNGDDNQITFLNKVPKGSMSNEEIALCREAQRHKATWYKEDLEKIGFFVEVVHENPYSKEKLLRDFAHIFGTDGGGVIYAVWNRND